MALSFYWHDYETFGVNPFKDRPSQFAGVRTDADLNIIGEPLMIYCKPPKDTLPSPVASLITGVTPQQCEEKGVIEAEFIKQIHQEFSKPETCGVGYNSIRFDDEFTRNTLYRNFYDPYEREYKNGNSRWDIIDVVRLCYALRPTGIEWPQNENGDVSFRLEHLTVANNLSHANAHDALSDVYATIDIARLIKKNQPQLFAHALSLRDKRQAGKYLDVARGTPVFHVSSKYPASQYCAAVVMPLAFDPQNANAVIVYDLSVNPEALLTLTAEEIKQRLFTKTADLPEGVERIALKTIHINKSPMLATINRVDEAAAKRLSIYWSVIEANQKRLLAQQGAIQQKLQQVFSGQQFTQASDVDGQIYQGFVNNSDKQTMTAVRQATPDALREKTWAFTDKRLTELLFRYRGRNWPESLDADEQEQWVEFCYQRIVEPNSAVSFHIESYFAEIERLKQTETSDKNQQILSELQAWGDILLAGE